MGLVYPLLPLDTQGHILISKDPSTTWETDLAIFIVGLLLVPILEKIAGLQVA